MANLRPFVLLALIINISYAQGLIATDPGVTCFINEECPANEYCLMDRFASFVCSPFAGLGDFCNSFITCGEGLFCEGSSGICQKQLPLNATCSDGFVSEENCEAPNRCSADTLTCQPLVPGTDGESCFTNADCAASFRCDQMKCVPSTPDFGPCMTFEDRCEGSCIPGVGICAPAVSLGGRCTGQVGCLPSEDADPAICNVPNGIDGRCVLGKSVITTLGTECDPVLDACDANRGLSCLFSSSVGKNVCQQRLANVENSFCDPNSEFSQCLPAFGQPTECLPDFVAPRDGGSDFFRCLVRKEELSIRSICSTPGSVCPEGTACTVLLFTSPLTSYCLPMLSEGQFCDDPFEGVCEFPLVCQDRVCTNGEENSDQPETISGLRGSCAGDLICAPGLVCRGKGSELLCLLPVVEVGPLEECFSTPSLDKICIEGSVCRRDANGRGVSRCRDPAEVGEFCSTNADCEQGLKCAMGNFLETKCYDPENSLGIGDTCGQAGSLPCGAADGELLMCLPQVGSNVPKCQKFRGLFSTCNPGENIGCFRSSNCESGLCIPK